MATTPRHRRSGADRAGGAAGGHRQHTRGPGRWVPSAAVGLLLAAAAGPAGAIVLSGGLARTNGVDPSDGQPRPTAATASQPPSSRVEVLGPTPAPLRRTARQPRDQSLDGSPETTIPEVGPGTFDIAAATSPAAIGATTYRVEVEEGLPFGTAAVARFVDRVFADPRGWSDNTDHGLSRVDGEADLRIVLATPQTADELCAPLVTRGRLSCRNGSDVVINAWRWQYGSDSYEGRVTAYRRYVVNHETGHALGFPHTTCPGVGRPAPVMVQQTKDLEGCDPNPWPARADLLAGQN